MLCIDVFKLPDGRCWDARRGVPFRPATPEDVEGARDADSLVRDRAARFDATVAAISDWIVGYGMFGDRIAGDVPLPYRDVIASLSNRGQSREYRRVAFLALADEMELAGDDRAEHVRNWARM